MIELLWYIYTDTLNNIHGEEESDLFWQQAPASWTSAISSKNVLNIAIEDFDEIDDCNPTTYLYRNTL